MVEYLNQELEKTNVAELRQAIYRLIEAQIKQKTLARLRDEYVFRVLDPAAPPDSDEIREAEACAVRCFWAGVRVHYRSFLRSHLELRGHKLAHAAEHAMSYRGIILAGGSEPAYTRLRSASASSCSRFLTSQWCITR